MINKAFSSEHNNIIAVHNFNVKIHIIAIFIVIVLVLLISRLDLVKLQSGCLG